VVVVSTVRRLAQCGSSASMLLFFEGCASKIKCPLMPQNWRGEGVRPRLSSRRSPYGFHVFPVLRISL
jgi:hypothetical protein